MCYYETYVRIEIKCVAIKHTYRIVLLKAVLSDHARVNNVARQR
jgi:hypothetical protein